jgi:hypothetical protein
MSRNKDRFEKNGDGKWHVVDHEANDESEEEDE